MGAATEPGPQARYLLAMSTIEAEIAKLWMDWYVTDPFAFEVTFGQARYKYQRHGASDRHLVVAQSDGEITLDPAPSLRSNEDRLVNFQPNPSGSLVGLISITATGHVLNVVDAHTSRTITRHALGDCASIAWLSDQVLCLPEQLADRTEVRILNAGLVAKTTTLGTFGVDAIIEIQHSGRANELVITVADGHLGPESLFRYEPSTAALKLIIDGNGGLTYWLGSIGSEFVVLQTPSAAPNGQIVLVDRSDNPTPTTIVPETDEFIGWAHLAGSITVVSRRHWPAESIEMWSPTAQRIARVDLPPAIYLSGLSGNSQGDVMVGLQGPITPRTSTAFDSISPTMDLETKVNAKIFHLWVQSNDGTDLPVTLYEPHASGELNGSVLLSCYGGFQYSHGTRYCPESIWWLERGGRVAFAHVGGGSELGAAWSDRGRGSKGKRLAARDLSACAHLVKDLVDGPMVLRGDSNGALIGSMLLLSEPQLFSGASFADGVFDISRSRVSQELWRFRHEYLDDGDAVAPTLDADTAAMLPPIQVIFAPDDRTVPASQSIGFVQLLAGAGAKVIPLPLLEAGHRERSVDDLAVVSGARLRFLRTSLGSSR